MPIKQARPEVNDNCLPACADLNIIRIFAAVAHVFQKYLVIPYRNVFVAFVGVNSFLIEPDNIYPVNSVGNDPE